ncbi:hypothetical protein AB0B28_13900 [Glycomyces sp. NPDC046736]|uniref:hypothetical protein n=1 Tax=Glycomyces sp. NPDC046736 TaxID=3155615 RepID=UPI0033F3719E
MTSRQHPKPVSPAGRVVLWVLLVFVILLTLGVGLSLIGDGVNGRRTLEEGPVGTFTPTERGSCETTCALIGDFTSADGTVIERDVELKGRRAVSSGPLPGEIEDVRLDAESRRPVAYTVGFDWRSSVFKGSAVLLVGVAVATVQVVLIRRHRRAST